MKKLLVFSLVVLTGCATTSPVRARRRSSVMSSKCWPMIASFSAQMTRPSPLQNLKDTTRSPSGVLAKISSSARFAPGDSSSSEPSCWLIGAITLSM